MDVTVRGGEADADACGSPAGTGLDWTGPAPRSMTGPRSMTSPTSTSTGHHITYHRQDNGTHLD